MECLRGYSTCRMTFLSTGTAATSTRLATSYDRPEFLLSLQDGMTPEPFIEGVHETAAHRIHHMSG